MTCEHYMKLNFFGTGKYRYTEHTLPIGLCAVHGCTGDASETQWLSWPQPADRSGRYRINSCSLHLKDHVCWCSKTFFFTTSESEIRSVMSDSLQPMDYTIHGILQARTLEWEAVPLLQGIFPTQGSNPGLPHCRWILYQVSFQGSLRALEWVAYPFSRGSSQGQE